MSDTDATKSNKIFHKQQGLTDDNDESSTYDFMSAHLDMTTTSCPTLTPVGGGGQDGEEA